MPVGGPRGRQATAPLSPAMSAASAKTACEIAGRSNALDEPVNARRHEVYLM